MKSDAMASSFFTGRTQQSRMDRAKSGQQPVQSQGFGDAEARIDDNEGFNATYNKVAQVNIQARKITDANTSSQPSDVHAKDQEQKGRQNFLCLQAKPQVSKQPVQDETQASSGSDALKNPVDPKSLDSMLPDATQILNLVLQQPVSLGVFKAPKTGDTPENLTIGELAGQAQGTQATGVHDVSGEASTIITQALTEVSKALNLSIDPGIQKLSLGSGSDGVAQQFSEILYTLKKIAGLLDEAVGQQQKIVMPDNSAIEAPAAKDMSAFLQTRIFRIEIGASMLGIGDQVQNDLSAKLELPSGLNIPQALDPAKVSMPQAQIEKIFGQLFQESSSSISTLVQKIRELCAQSAQQQDGAAAANAAVKNVLADGAPRTAQDVGLFSVDTQVMRKLLKIEAKEVLASQNTDAATQAGKLDLSIGALKINAKSGDSSAAKLATELFPTIDASAKSAAAQVLASFEAKSTAPAYRTLDDSVMSQITEKLNNAIRSGVTEIRLQLRPESLGDVQLRIRVDGDVVFARIQVESQQVKQIVESNMQLLKDSLSQQHLQAGSLEVNVGNDGSNQNDGQVHDHAHGGATVASVNSGETAPVPEAGALAQGVETGRRFGDNTVEYFA